MGRRNTRLGPAYSRPRRHMLCGRAVIRPLGLPFGKPTASGWWHSPGGLQRPLVFHVPIGPPDRPQANSSYLLDKKRGPWGTSKHPHLSPARCRGKGNKSNGKRGRKKDKRSAHTLLKLHVFALLLMVGRPATTPLMVAASNVKMRSRGRCLGSLDPVVDQ